MLTFFYYSLLEMMLDSTSSIRRSDINTLFSAIASTGVGNKIAFDFLVNRWNDIEAAYASFVYLLINQQAYLITMLIPM